MVHSRELTIFFFDEYWSYTGPGAVVNIAINLFLIERYGITGAV